MQFFGGQSTIYKLIIWKQWAPPQIKVFVWLLLQERIWTADRLQRRGWPNEYFCQLCYRNLEMPLHLFYECRVTKQLWTSVATWLHEPQLQPDQWSPAANIHDWYQNIPQNLHGKRLKGVRSMILVTIWTIWKERNDRIFKKQERTVESLLSAVQEEAKSWKLAGAKNLEHIGVPHDRE